MKKGTISIILNYYFKNPHFQDIVLKAIREFFDKPDLDLKSTSSLNSTEEEKAKFNEWFIFDFCPEGDKTLLEEFYYENPLNLPQKELSVYKDIQNNKYGIFEIIKVKIGKSLRLKDLQDNKEYLVQEHMGTFGSIKGDIIIGRVGKVKDHFELVGSDSLKLPIILTENAKAFLSQTKDKLNPKIIRGLLG